MSTNSVIAEKLNRMCLACGQRFGAHAYKGDLCPNGESVFVPAKELPKQPTIPKPILSAMFDLLESLEEIAAIPNAGLEKIRQRLHKTLNCEEGGYE